MQLISISFHGESPPKGGTPNRCPRGTAEVEAALVIPILLMILFLVGATVGLGRARLRNVYNAENDAYGQVVSGIGTTASSDPEPVDGINVVRPALPNRFDYANPTQTINLDLRWDNAVVHLDDKAIFLDSSWHFSSIPNTGDQAQIQAWFSAYVEESHPPELVYSLGLRPPGPP